MRGRRNAMIGGLFTAAVVFGSPASVLSAGESVREPAVAGQFYPADPDSLRDMVKQDIAAGKALPVVPRIIISPHAGYRFTGPVTGKGYAAIDPSVTTVIIMGPPHYVPVSGIAVPSVEWFRTPLGDVPLDRDRIRTLLENSIAYVDDRAHAPEHSIEAEIPFLQVRCPSFKIVPLIVSETDPVKAAEAIYPLIDDHTLVIASSDFSHYLTQKAARAEDDKSIATILAGNVDGMIDACGEMPIRVAMVLAKKMGLEPRLLDAKTSFDTAPEEGPGRVVGYASIVFVPAAAGSRRAIALAKTEPEATAGLPAATKNFLLALARQSLEAAVRGEELPQPRNIPDAVQENRGCFVTLTAHGQLRGCIGYIEPIKPLYRAVMDNAQNAALSDPRFPPVAPGELSSIKVEVSVLTRPVALDHKDPRELLQKLVPGVDGVILELGPDQSTFLPQVWGQIPDKVQFLEQLSLKGGMPRDGWKTAHVKRYRAEHFSE